MGSLPQSGRQMYQQAIRSGHNSTVASRSGSIPPSRSGDEQHSYFGADVLTNPQSSRFNPGSTSFPSQRPSHSTQPSTYSSHAGNRRHGGEQPSNNYDVDFITGELRKMNPGKENEYPQYPSYHSSHEQSSQPYDYPQRLDGSTHAWSADEVGYQNGLNSFTPNGIPPGSQNQQYNQSRKIQFGEHSPQSPNGSDARRSHHSPFYPTGGTPPSGDQYHAPSRGVANPRAPHGQAALLERKLRGLQQEQQGYIQPQPNPLQFRAPFTHPYEYNPQTAMRVNPLAQYYPIPAVPNFLPPMIPRGPSRDHDVGQNLRSALLEEFRSNSKTNKRYELKDIYNHIVEFSGDQHGSRFIQQKLETANSDEKDQVFREIQPNSIQLMTDVFGNYVIQKFFEHGNQSQKKILANQMKNHILTLSLQMYGCRVVQKALEHILTDQQASLVKELEQHVLRCVKDQNGNHVVQKAIERVPAEHIQFIINAFTGQVQSLATHPYGCRVIQRMLEHCAEPARTSVLQELHACASSLIVDQYGNYVTQHVIEHGREGDRAKIVSLVTSQLLTFSKHKFASNVVEKSIQFGSDEQRQMIIATLTALNDKGESPLQSLMRDQYGNYVIQKLLAQLAGSEYDEFVENIKPQLALLKRFSYGKQIAAIEKVIYNNPTPVQHNHNVSPPTSVAPTPPPLTSDAHSPQSSSLPSTNNSTVDGPVGDRKSRTEGAVEVDVATTT
ncbi:MAG: hypothetical protein LQ347_001455 [Umbilicaria vellea]|nr:MAG: hypothetical protein LQ347_001455 [Umbilicaria vellea]